MKLLLSLLLVMNAFVFLNAQNHHDELYFNAPLSNNSVKKDKPVQSSLSEKDFHLYNAGTYSIQSAKCAYIAFGSSALAGIVSVLAGDVNNWDKYKAKTGDTPDRIEEKTRDAKDLKNALLVSAGIFSIVAITSTIIAINYKMKSGKELRLSATNNGAIVSLSF